jgi:hypothetical protein
MVLRVLPLGALALGIGCGVLVGELAVGTALGVGAGLVLESARIAADRAP